eukprot:14421010-Alexandrium_andersonii.AAC.1
MAQSSLCWEPLPAFFLLGSASLRAESVEGLASLLGCCKGGGVSSAASRGRLAGGGVGSGVGLSEDTASAGAA